MLFKKNHRRITTVGASLLALLFLTTCKRLNTKDDFIYTVSAVMPNTDTPIPGVKIKIVEFKYKSGTAKPTGWEINEVTDAQGKAYGRFMGVRKTNYSYTIYFDYSEIVLPEGIDDVSISGPQYAPLTRYPDQKSNDYQIRVLPYTSYHFKVENVNCFDSNDKMRFKTFNYDDQPYQDFQYMPWGDYSEGCGLHIDYSSDHILAGHKVFLIEVTRNGIVTTDIDTFNLQPNMVNEVFLEY